MEQKDPSLEITHLLDTYHSQTLQGMVKASNLDSGGKKLAKNDLIAFMKKEFFTEKRVKHALTLLTKQENAVLNRLQLRGYTSDTRSFKREIIRAGLATEGEPPKPSKTPFYEYYNQKNSYEGSPYRPNSTVFEDVMARLTLRGLVFTTNQNDYPSPQAKLTFHLAEKLYIPQAIQPYLPPIQPLPVIQNEQSIVHSETADPQLFLRDLYLYWDFVRRNQVSLVQGGTIGKRSLKTLNDILLQPDKTLDNARREDETRHLFLLRLLLEALSLTQQKMGELQIIGKGSQVIPPFWKQSTAAQAKQCLEAWSALTNWQELDKETNSYYPRYPHARQLLLKGLVALKTSTWMEREELVGWLQDQERDFLFTGHAQLESKNQAYGYRVGGVYIYQGKEDLNKQLDQQEAEFVTQCVAQFLHPLGLVELGYHQEKPTYPPNEWQLLRLTHLGQQVLGLQPLETSNPEQGKIVVQPNFQILAIGPVSLATLATCDSFAERKKIDRGAVEYHLSRESVYAAQQMGFAVQEIADWLVNVSGVALPQNVRRSLEEWGSHHERIVFRTRVNLVQANTVELLENLLTEAGTGKFLRRLEGPALAVIQKGKIKPLVNTLVKQNILPAVTGADPEAANYSVLIDANGRIQPIHAVPNLHLHGRLVRIAEKTADGVWQLTPHSVQRVGDGRAGVEQLLNELNRLNRGPLPAPLVNQLKIWGQYHGTATAQTLTLIEFREPSVLQEIMADSALRPYFTPFPAGDRTLAAVAASDLPQIEKLLIQMGIPLIHI